jgi:hypothetical protein
MSLEMTRSLVPGAVESDHYVVPIVTCSRIFGYLFLTETTLKGAI